MQQLPFIVFEVLDFMVGVRSFRLERAGAGAARLSEEAKGAAKEPGERCVKWSVTLYHRDNVRGVLGRVFGLDRKGMVPLTPNEAETFADLVCRFIGRS